MTNANDLDDSIRQHLRSPSLGRLNDLVQRCRHALLFEMFRRDDDPLESVQRKSPDGVEEMEVGIVDLCDRSGGPELEDDYRVAEEMEGGGKLAGRDCEVCEVSCEGEKWEDV